MGKIEYIKYSLKCEALKFRIWWSRAKAFIYKKLLEEIK